MFATLAGFSARRWVAAALAAVATLAAVGIPTDLIANPLFDREIPPTPWAWPTLLVTSALSGLLVATYVRQGEGPPSGLNRSGTLGGLLTYVAVGCPVCNKLALVALGYTGALRWFAPVQPYLAVAGIALLAWALAVRLRGERACPVPPRRREPADSAIQSLGGGE